MFLKISIRTPGTRCLIYTCKIPANSLQNLLSYGDLSPLGGYACTEGRLEIIRML